MLTYLALRCLSFLVPLLPPWLGYRLAILLGDLSYCLLWRTRRSVAANLRRVLPESASAAQRRAVARSVFRTGAMNHYDLFRVPRLDLDRLRQLITVRGWEHLDVSFRRGKGAIVVVPHLGNLDVVGQIAVLLSVPCTIPTEHVRPQRLLDLVTSMRASRGLSIVPIDRGASAARIIYQALRRNELVGIVGDRDVQAHGLPVLFFGQLTSFPSGPVALALRTGAPLHAGRTLRIEGGAFEVEITPPLDLPHTGDAKQTVRLGTQLVAATLEGFIREAPGQWVVFEPVWPDGGNREDLGDSLEAGGGLGKRLLHG